MATARRLSASLAASHRRTHPTLSHARQAYPWFLVFLFERVPVSPVLDGVIQSRPVVDMGNIMRQDLNRRF